MSKHDIKLLLQPIGLLIIFSSLFVYPFALTDMIANNRVFPLMPIFVALILSGFALMIFAGIGGDNVEGRTETK